MMINNNTRANPINIQSIGIKEANKEVSAAGDAPWAKQKFPENRTITKIIIGSIKYFFDFKSGRLLPTDRQHLPMKRIARPYFSVSAYSYNDYNLQNHGYMR